MTHDNNTTDDNSSGNNSPETFKEFKDMEFSEQRKFVSRKVEELRDIEDDVTPEDHALIGQLVNAQTSHEKTVTCSMSMVLKVEKSEYSSTTKLKVELISQSHSGYLNTELPEQDGQFGSWKITGVTGWQREKGVSTRTTFEVGSYEIELQHTSRDAFLNQKLFGGDE